MTTVLDKELRRQITVDGADYTVVIGPDGMRPTGRGSERPTLTFVGKIF